MNRNRVRAVAAWILAAASGGALMMAAATAAARQETRQQGPRGKRGSIARKFHNIKVLGDLPAEQLLPIMQEWNVALGVKCEFCHVEVKTEEGKTVVDYEKETNPMKDVAREMYTLTTNLNAKEKTVGNSVTCFMCHRSEVVPTAKAAPKTEKPGTPKPAAKPATSKKGGK